MPLTYGLLPIRLPARQPSHRGMGPIAVALELGLGLKYKHPPSDQSSRILSDLLPVLENSIFSTDSPMILIVWMRVMALGPIRAHTYFCETLIRAYLPCPGVVTCALPWWLRALLILAMPHANSMESKMWVFSWLSCSGCANCSGLWVQSALELFGLVCNKLVLFGDVSFVCLLK